MRVSLKRSLGFAALCTLLASASAGAQEAPHLLADINHSPYVPFSFEVHEEPRDFFNLEGRLLFSTADPSSLDQGILWTTDGTARGTRQMSTTLCPAACARISPLGSLNGVALLEVVVSSPDGLFSMSQLGRTDGTPEGSYPLGGNFDPSGLRQVFPMPDSGVFLFPDCVSAPYCRLWRSDTTRAGTGPFLGTDGLPFLAPQAFSFWRGRLYFVAMHGEGGEAGLWSTDGTPAGTLFIHAAGELDGRSVLTVATASHLFFTARENGEDLWATDGSAAGTLRLADFDPQACDSCLPDADLMTASGDRVYFETHRAGHAIQIWESDGTPQGTRPRIELPARVVYASSFERVGGHWLFVAITSWENPGVFWTVDDGFSRASRLTACDGGTCPWFYFPLSPPGALRKIFVGGDNLHGFDPWVTDGTAAGTRRLADVCGEYCSDGNWPDGSPGVTSPGGALLFHVFMPRNDWGTREDELWRTDGTPEGTWRLAEHVDGFGFLKGVVYYGSSGGSGHLGSGLWATDGTAGNAHRVASLRRLEPGSAPVFQAFRDGALILTANAAGQAALWRSDGTPHGTFPVHDFSSETRKVYASFLDASGPLQFLFLTVQPADRQERSELWRTDGTPEGTRAILRLSPSEFIVSATAWRGGLVFDFESFASPESCALWSSDGTAAGTHQLFPTASFFHCPQPLTALGADFLYTVPDGGGHPFSRLFRSDGTAAGTREIARLGGFVADPLLVGGTVFFRVVSDTSTEIWQTDGTPAGTHRTTTLADPSDLQEFAGSLYLTAALGEDHEAGRALFRLSPSGGPPIQLAKLFPYSESQLSVPVQFAPVEDRLLFTVQNFARGLELWSTDGTPEGTRRLRSLQPTPDFNRQPAILAAAGDRVFFPASDGVHGWELWESDGTPEGTRMVTDLAPGGFSSMPAYSSFAVTDRFLFFAADDDQTGLEPWALPLAP